jgi:hypothetical protein
MGDWIWSDDLNQPQKCPLILKWLGIKKNLSLYLIILILFSRISRIVETRIGLYQLGDQGDFNLIFVGFFQIHSNIGAKKFFDFLPFFLPGF